MRRDSATAASRIAIAVGAVALVTVAYTQLLQVNPTTVALTYLVVILLIATGWGISESTIASLAAMLCFNFFFLPPVGTLTIADPQNWVALLAFLVTAVVASQLSGRATRRQNEAVARQRDLERLYALSRSLLLSEHGAIGPGGMARHIAQAFEARAVGVYEQRSDTAAWAGPDEVPRLDARLRETARTGAASPDVSGIVITAIQLGGTPIGSVAIKDLGLSDTVLQSIANLVAIGLERARADEATARAEAARASSELRATVLDALAHEFKTPLTSMKAASSDLLASSALASRDRELVTIIDEELDRFQALVTDAVQMLRIDAGDFAVHARPHRLADLVQEIAQKVSLRLDGRPLVRRIPDDLVVEADRELLGLALRQLVDNAIKYSPATSAIEIRARANGAVEIDVHNAGSTIPASEQPRIFERFFRGTHARHIPGTGMGLAIVDRIARAHGGTLTVASSPADGTTLTLALPRSTAGAAAGSHSRAVVHPS
jgi:two-component system sensor histidine kinase KdpD